MLAKTTVSIVATGLLLAATTVFGTPERNPTIDAAACQDGTCCPEETSKCVIGEWVRYDKYAKLTGGQCKAGDISP